MIDRLRVWALCAALALFPALADAQSPIKSFPPGTFQNKAAIDPAVAASYQGPGDIVASATAWGSCARAYNAAYANGTNSMCDLVDSTTGSVAICTLRVLTTGFVDLAGSYCTGSTTPTLACAAAAGGACKVTKVYDQTGGGNHWTNATAAQMPTLTFSAQNSLPGLTYTSAANASLANVNSIVAAQPYSLTGVAKRTANFTTAQMVLATGSGTVFQFGFNTSTNTAFINYVAAAITATASNSAFHALQGVVNNASSVLTVDGTDTTGTVSSSSAWTNAFRIGRGSACCTIDGVIMEVGFWNSKAFSVGERTSLDSNMRGATNGYNF